MIKVIIGDCSFESDGSTSLVSEQQALEKFIAFVASRCERCRLKEPPVFANANDFIPARHNRP